MDYGFQGPPRRPRRSASAINVRSTDQVTIGRTIAAARLGYVAAELGARFVRERKDFEPITWLMSPSPLFGGRIPLHACQGSEGFRRAVILHGLGLALDAKPAHIEGVPVRHFLSRVAQSYLRLVPPSVPDAPDRWGDGLPSLYTCSISAELDSEHAQIFCAMLAHSAAEVRFRLRQRYGPLLEDEARVRLGFDWSEPLASAMVSEAMAHLLELAADDPSSPIASGLDFHVEQRFSS